MKDASSPTLSSMPARAALRAAGFTLVELLLVVAILGVLAGVAIFNVGGKMGESQIAAARSSIATIKTACDAYEIKTGKYPDSMDALLQPVGGGAPLLDSNAKADPWGNPYQIRKSGYSVEIRSAGPDGAFNTEDDITNAQ